MWSCTVTFSWFCFTRLCDSCQFLLVKAEGCTGQSDSAKKKCIQWNIHFIHDSDNWQNLCSWLEFTSKCPDICRGSQWILVTVHCLSISPADCFYICEIFLLLCQLKIVHFMHLSCVYLNITIVYLVNTCKIHVRYTSWVLSLYFLYNVNYTLRHVMSRKIFSETYEKFELTGLAYYVVKFVQNNHLRR